ncbi:hypothetical protein Tco_1140178 [Tanacetum coccineum]
MPNFRGRSRGSHKALTSRSTPKGRGGSSIVGRGREIADEWSPRGRGSNSTSGNDRDIQVEGTPIGRGSNNTSGNGSDRADECSPRGIGSNSIIGPGNERADEWCSGQDILSDERVDVHEDNEDHVENVTGSSQDQVVSNVTPTSSLPKLWLIGRVFYDPAISLHAVKLFETMFKSAYATWTQVPQVHRDRCFSRFEVYNNQIRDAWESHIRKRYSDIIRCVRKAAMKVTRVNDNVDIRRISSSPPNWIGANDWSTMEKKKGRRVKLVELHTQVHAKKGTKPGEPGTSEIPKFVDQMDKQRLVTLEVLLYDI